ncbi:MAG TPA: DUF92 domain-containing protein [Ktedonobacterales bacterium]|nr:DUF92 domain-containing protein [Ktedonobacterales bacterium]
MKLRRLLLGLVFSGAIGLVAERRGSLTRSGAAGAVLTGTTIFGFGGLAWGLTLIYFFLSSTFLSHFKEREKSAVAADKFSKGARRDLAQALANAGVASAAALAYGLRDQSPDAALLAAFVGALATANGDTWATEVGTLSQPPPRLITSGQPVAPGTSGGVTLLGTGAALAGAASVGLVAEVLGAGKKTRLRGWLPLLGMIGGMAGTLTDSVLGATAQAMYWCPRCQQETERRVHHCGQQTEPLRGLRWLDNDGVNFASTAAGAMVTALLARALTGCRAYRRQSR